jgi:hypothetical protein
MQQETASLCRQPCRTFLLRYLSRAPAVAARFFGIHQPELAVGAVDQVLAAIVLVDNNLGRAVAQVADCAIRGYSCAGAVFTCCHALFLTGHTR